MRHAKQEEAVLLTALKAVLVAYVIWSVFGPPLLEAGRASRPREQ